MKHAREIQLLKEKIKCLISQINLLTAQKKQLLDFYNKECEQNRKLLEDIQRIQEQNAQLRIKIEQLSYEGAEEMQKKIKKRYQKLPSDISYYPDSVKINNVIIRDIVEKDAIQCDKYFVTETINFACSIRAISPKCYEYIRTKIPFPSPHICNSFENRYQNDFPEALIKLDMVSTIINNWKNKNNIDKSKVIQACLSVDALFFHPDIKIYDNDVIEGMQLSTEDKKKIPRNAKKLFMVNPALFESFIQYYWKDVTKAGFVFQLQPYDTKFKTVVLHVKPTVNGKASEDIISILQHLRYILKNRNITVRSFAFDGDSAYRDLHLEYYHSYIFSCFSNSLNLNNTRAFRVVSDFLHLIKRLRYRLLSCRLHPGFSKNNPFINISEIKNILSDLPNVIFRNEGFTKMHDRLPLLLFSSENYIKLFNKKQYIAAAYWFPITSAMIAIDNPDISRSAREFFLECSLWFLVYYAKAKKGSYNDIKQRKRGDSLDVCFYTDEILVEFTNTIHCNLQLVHSLQEYSFDRNSTMPLEHLFGRARIKARNIHTLRKFIKNISDFQNFDVYTSNEKIAGRRSSFGVSVNELSNERNSDYIDKDEIFSLHEYSARRIAFCSLYLGGFEKISEEPVVDIDMTPIYWYTTVLEHLLLDDESKKAKLKKNNLSWNSITLGTNRGSRAKALIKSQCAAFPSSSNNVQKNEQ